MREGGGRSLKEREPEVPSREQEKRSERAKEGEKRREREQERGTAGEREIAQECVCVREET